MAPLKKKKRLNLAEILDNLDEDDVGDIYIQPPENVTETTDDEFGDDDNDICNILSNKMLLLPAEVKASRKENIPSIQRRYSKRLILNRSTVMSRKNITTAMKRKVIQTQRSDNVICEDFGKSCEHEHKQIQRAIKRKVIEAQRSDNVICEDVGKSREHEHEQIQRAIKRKVIQTQRSDNVICEDFGKSCEHEHKQIQRAIKRKVIEAQRSDNVICEDVGKSREHEHEQIQRAIKRKVIQRQRCDNVIYEDFDGKKKLQNKTKPSSPVNTKKMKTTRICDDLPKENCDKYEENLITQTSDTFICDIKENLHKSDKSQVKIAQPVNSKKIKEKKIPKICDNLPMKDCDKNVKNREPSQDKLKSSVKIKKAFKRKANGNSATMSQSQFPKPAKIRRMMKQKSKFSTISRTKVKGNERKKCNTKEKNDEIEWSIGGETLPETQFGFTVTTTDGNNMSSTDYFELFFDNELLEWIIFESTQYCISKNLPDIQLTKAELRTFMAILIVSGYNPLPSKAMHWNKGKDLRNQAIYESMRRDRFDNIMKSLHFASMSNLDITDKYSKLRPIISRLQKNFMKHFSPAESISHDEAMVEYFGNHGCKQSIRDKPIRFGFKVFCQNTPSGYLVAFDPYQGKTYQGDEEMEKQFGKSASSLLHILDTYPISKSEYPYHFYCDNYFTSLPLCTELKNRGYNCTGTIRANRLGKNCPLTDVKKFAKKERGYIEVATAKISDDKVFLSRWKDNAVVTVASTQFAVNPEGSVKRWCKNEKKHIQVPIPHSINNYNRNMGGTDRTDQNVNVYRISIRGKKWWWCLFTWMLDVSVQNAWLLARKANPKLVQLQFRRDLAMSYMSAHSQPPKTPGRKRKISSENQTMRFDKIGHFVRNTGNNKQRRCRGNNCKSKVRTECLKCNVGLCITCFETYHTVA